MDRIICPISTRATVPYGLPHAPRIPVCSLWRTPVFLVIISRWEWEREITHLSAPAHDNILFILRTWNGCTRTRKWKESLPATFVTYLFAQIRAASSASDDNCSYSSDTRWQQNGNSSTDARFRPRSKIRIYVMYERIVWWQIAIQRVGRTFGSGTPRLYLDFG